MNDIPTCRKCYCRTVADPLEGCDCQCHRDFYQQQTRPLQQVVDEGADVYGFVKITGGEMAPVVVISTSDTHVRVRSLSGKWEGVGEFWRTQFYMAEGYPGQLAELYRLNMRRLGIDPAAYRMHTSGG